tara:strand:+ start:518 stop:1045 length:528 start_codon:yes stop_codon:yes gene_type:complete
MVRKKRQLSEEQRQELRERLEKAREAKAPSQQLTINESLRGIPDTDPFSPARVRGWIRNTQLKLKALRGLKDSKDLKERAMYVREEVYLGNLQNYLRTGVYCDNRWGAEQQHKVSYKCVAMAYYADGTAKRSVGVWYPDIGGKYTVEMAEEDNAKRSVPDKVKVHKSYRNMRKKV